MVERFPKNKGASNYDMDGNTGGKSNSSHEGSASTAPALHYLYNKSKEMYEGASALTQPHIKVGIVLDQDRYEPIGLMKPTTGGNTAYLMALADTGCQSTIMSTR
jgi:hypothetical protein